MPKTASQLIASARNSQNPYNLANFYKSITQKHPLFYGNQFIIQFYGKTLEQFSFYKTYWGTQSQYNPTFWIKSASIPKSTIGQVTATFFATDFKVPGAIQYPDTWDVKLITDQSLTQYKFFKQMAEYVSSLDRSGGGIKVIPDLRASVHLLDSTMQYITTTYIIQGIWVSKIGQLQMAYNAGESSIMQTAVTFSMQYFYESPDGSTASDPLLL